MDVRYDIIKAITALPRSREPDFKEFGLSASEDACRLSGTVANFAHPVNIFTLTDVFSKEFHYSIFTNHNQKDPSFRSCSYSNEFD